MSKTPKKPTVLKKPQKSEVLDVVVIGAGPAGMMAASTAAADGVRVLLLEKNSVLGKKLLITGGGRCNITNNKPKVRDMLSEYKAEGKFLFSTFMQHGVKETIEWFDSRKVPFKEENEGRLFPASNSAKTVCDALVTELEEKEVEIRSKQEVTGIFKNHITGDFEVSIKGQDKVIAHTCIVATGGTACPGTGSTGEGFDWLKSLGHTVVPNSNTLVPLTLKNNWTTVLSGVSLPKVKISVWAEDKKQSVHNGKLLFTHVGVTGPMILNLSKSVGDYLEYSAVILKLDLFPDISPGDLKEHVQVLLSDSSNKKLQNVLCEDLPRQVVKVILEQLEIDGETSCHSVSRTNRMKLISFLKAVPLEVGGLLGSDKAVASAGGVTLEEVDFKTMESKIVSGLYVVGDTLNINRPSGGYGLQLCWSTGYVAGIHAAKQA